MKRWLSKSTHFLFVGHELQNFLDATQFIVFSMRDQEPCHMQGVWYLLIQVPTPCCHWGFAAFWLVAALGLPQ